MVSEIGFGAWAIGSAWGQVSATDALAALNKSIDLGINFIDTADVYGDGRSEQLVSQVLKSRTDRIYVATKAGRKLDPHVATSYSRENLTSFVEESLRNLRTDVIDLLQLHCPPFEVYYAPEVFGILDDLVQAGKILYYGVSVEKVEEAIKAIEYPNLQSVQIIFNIFRQRPLDLFFPLAKDRRIGILARVPLASGLLTGKMTSQTQFPSDDHRNYNRHGESFDVGETFSGVDYETGLDAVEALRPLAPPSATMSQFALRWILMSGAVGLAIPGAKNAGQASDNAAASDLAPFDEATMAQIRKIYEDYFREKVHQRW
jgi:aryl-alcohol dehydrogenase-like predicted oxidoreductase